jgi:hypothetical protein
MKKETGNWYGGIAPVLGVAGITAIFMHLLYRSMSPSGSTPPST